MAVNMKIAGLALIGLAAFETEPQPGISTLQGGQRIGFDSGQDFPGLAAGPHVGRNGYDTAAVTAVDIGVGPAAIDIYCGSKRQFSSRMDLSCRRARRTHR